MTLYYTWNKQKRIYRNGKHNTWNKFLKIIEGINSRSDPVEERFGEREQSSEYKREKQRNYEKEVKNKKYWEV